MNEPSSLFDPQQLLENLEINQEMATKYVVVPAGRYNMQIQAYTSRRVIPDDATKKPFTTFEVDCIISGTEKDPITGATLKDITGRDDVKVRYQGFLDFTEGGALALGPGQNVALGRLREAVGLNVPGQPFKFGMLKGQVFNGEVFHRPNPKDPETPFAEVRNPLPRQ